MHASLIWKAAYDGDVERMQQLVSDGAGYLMGPHDLCTVLHVAAWRGHTHVVNMLLADETWAASGSRDGYGGGSPVPHPSVNIADRYGLYPLHYAMRGLHVDIAETLIAHGADADSNLCPNFMEISGQSPDKENWSKAPLLFASCAMRPTETASFQGQNVSTTAAEWGHRRLEMMNLLLSHRARVPPVDSDSEVTFNLWENALGGSPFNDDDMLCTGMLKLLIAYDTHRISYPGDYTAAHMAAGLNYRGEYAQVGTIMLNVLAENGYNLDGRDRRGMTPLYIAAQARNLHIVQYLLDAGADIQGDEFTDEETLGAGEEAWGLIMQKYRRQQWFAFAKHRISDELAEEVFSHVNIE
ncbi:ankyrin repeat-containing domain protein [Baffinella frigidus]|nr:ankyrin repeat-containing domain protein [Cryptophyta sp. CCMP2293]